MAGRRGGETRAGSEARRLAKGSRMRARVAGSAKSGSERGKAGVGRASRGEAATARRLLRGHGWPRATGVTERAFAGPRSPQAAPRVESKRGGSDGATLAAAGSGVQGA